jgi:hypothetical protein
MATRAALRRELGVRTGQLYFKRFGGSAGTASANGTTTTLIDTVRLKEADDFWNQDWIYFPASDEVREISDFDNATSKATWLAPATSTVATTAYEIWSQFSPNEVHSALDYALNNAWPYFFEVGNDETTCLIGDAGMTATIPTTNTVRRLCEVYLKVYDGFASTVTTVGGAATQLTDASPPRDFAATDVGKVVCIYEDDDNNAGEVRSVTAYVSASELTTAAFSAAPAEDAKYRLLDPNDMNPGQLKLSNWTVDKLDNPTKVWFGSFPSGYEGYPLYYVYEYECAPMTAETSTNGSCPLEYVYNMGLAYLYMLKMSSAPAVELPTWELMHRHALRAAQRHEELHRFAHLPSSLVRFNASFGVSSDYPF